MKENGVDLFANQKSTNSKPAKSSGESQSVDISSPGVGSQVARRIKADIDDYCIKTYDGGHRWHLGASLIGHECKRYLWYVYRWCFRETGTDAANHARKQRLFNRGHREEARYIEWLEGIGCEVHYENRQGLMYHPESDSYWIQDNPDDFGDSLSHQITEQTEGFERHLARAKADGLEFPQYRVSAVNGHFGGSLDAIVKLPPSYGIESYLLGEFKTNGTGQGFNKLNSEGMALAKPQHYAQTSTYGSDPNYLFTHCAYFNINKNDDDLHVEIVKLDWKLGQQMRDKAELIITSQKAPPRLSDNPTFHSCVYCPAKDICHKGAVPERNCRSCAHAVPIENGEWGCLIHNGTIPRDFVPNACPSYKAVTQNV